MISIFVDDTDNLETVVDYLKINKTNFVCQSLWDPNENNNQGANKLPSIYNSLLIINFQKFFDLIKYNQQELIDFSNQNYIWVWSDMDGSYPLKHSEYETALKNFDIVAPNKKIYYFIDGLPTTHSWIWNLKNIQLKIYPYNIMVGRATMRITGGVIYKNIDAKDFLITSVLKPIAPHREILKNKLDLMPTLSKSSTIKFHASIKALFENNNYLGDYNSHIAFPTEVPSMNLYCNHFLEVAPETFCDSCLCVTEKTLRPIMAKTPFITVAPPGQLEYLKSLGFKTFGDVFDESYDQELVLENRIDMILDSMEQITHQGAQNVYNLCQDILEHNHRNLMTLAGGWKYNIDLFITQTLAEISG
jgi:hypothetical protein